MSHAIATAIAATAHEAAIEAHLDAIRRRSYVAACEAAIQTETALEETIAAVGETHAAVFEAAVAHGEAETAEECLVDRMLAEARARHRDAIVRHRAAIALLGSVL